jgi:adenylate cyclase
MSETRKLAAILVADVVGYSRLAGADEERTLARLRGLRSDLIDPAIAAHHGSIVKRTGDGAIIEFRSVVDAVRCAVEVQTGMLERNAGVPPERRIEFRLGIHVGDVVEENDGDLMGDGVNIAARLEGIAKPGAICAFPRMPQAARRNTPRALRPAKARPAKPMSIIAQVEDSGTARVSKAKSAKRRCAAAVGCPLSQNRYVSCTAGIVEQSVPDKGSVKLPVQQG